ncbi:GTP-binding protein [Acetobacter sp. TBRC 12305]|uniref:GTP-binding protein n=1 Tax=Acetobacter garciniae TaxID=2817435 RepID=A0A939HN09_9PROT|nr:GTP-binding protein [Acetobacter garciniae]MBO1325995.1 GTP-binding protein [Acetobacter garciniae]MBX0345895.1 GTP-binding protein [Acetobacter garciniae]
MILTDIQIEAVRRFASPVRLEGLGPGLNVLAAPNETGKTTLLMALRAVLMLRHGSRAQAVKDLLPYGGGAPHIGLAFQWRDRACWLEKRFWNKSLARLDLGGERFDGEEAEEQLRTLLELDRNGRGEASGLWNALLVRQGESFAQPELAGAGHASVQACLEQTMQDATGVAAASALLGRVRERLGQLQTATGRPTGRFRQVQEDRDRAEQDLAALKARKVALEEDLGFLEQDRRMLREHESPERRQQEEETLHALRQTRERLRGLAVEEQALRATGQAVAQQAQAAAEEQAARRESAASLARLEHDLQTHGQDAAHLVQQAEAASARHARAQLATSQAVRAQQQARAVLHRVTRRLELARQAEALGHDRTVLARAQDAFAWIEQAQVDLASLKVDTAFMRRLAKATQAVEQARAIMQAQATMLVAQLQDGAAGRVTLNGQPCPSGRTLLAEAAELVVEGIGRFGIVPAIDRRDHAQKTLDDAQAAQSALLAEVGCASVAEAEALHDRRSTAEQHLAQAQATFAAILPGHPVEKAATTLATLRQNLAEAQAIHERAMAALQAESGAESGAGAQQPDLDNAQASRAEDEAAQRAEQARAQEQAAFTHATAAQAAAEKAGALCRQLEASCARIRQDLTARQTRESDPDLAARLAALLGQQATLEADLAAKVQLRESEPPLSVIESGIRRREEAQETMRATTTRLREDIRERETRVRMAEGDGLDEAIAEATRHLARVTSECEACARDRAALALLEQTLANAEKEQTERYLAPLVQAMQPAFSALFPGAKLEMNTRFGLSGLTRQRYEEVEHLSDGTREQIAVLVRLGFAELLHARGMPAVLVLDDALGFSDSTRMECLFDVLADAATRIQILLMTCRAEQFTPLGGRVLKLRQHKAVAAPG